MTLGAAAPPVEAPLVLIGREGRRKVALALDAAARRAGLRVGMPAAKAQALVPGLIMRDADPVTDAGRDFERGQRAKRHGGYHFLR